MRSDPARQTQDASAGGGAGGGSGSGAGARVATEREPRENGDERAPVAGKRTEGLEPERGAGRGMEKPAETPPGKVPPRADAPDGDGDDVVARQLREAAERETDPVMKEKLMEEYKRYKEATS